MSAIETNVTCAVLGKYQSDLEIIKHGRDRIATYLEHSSDIKKDKEMESYLNKKLNRLSTTISRLEDYIEEFKETHANILN